MATSLRSVGFLALLFAWGCADGENRPTDATSGDAPPDTTTDGGTRCATNADCADDDPCTINELCLTLTGTCSSGRLDADGDGDSPTSCGGGDCDDNDATRGTTRAELCDGIDNDCDGTADGTEADDDCEADEYCSSSGACAQIPTDGGSDTGTDAGVDAGADAGADTGTDAGADTGTDAGADTGTDTGVDTGGGGACHSGAPCTGPGTCANPTDECLEEVSATVGGASDPITGYDAGIPATYFENGYCTPVGPRRTYDEGACDPYDDGACGGCGTCLEVDDEITMCLAECVPSATEQTCPGDGQECSYVYGVCWPFGCHSDDECAVYREDTDGDGVVSADDGDLLVFDTDGEWTCNGTTFRCEHAGTPGAQAGSTCVKDSDCEANGVCFEAWPGGGYCTKVGCDVAGRDCVGEGSTTICDDRPLGFAACLQGCTVGELAPAGDEFDPPAQCAEGYACMWDGAGAEGAALNGACIPGEYNAVRTPNIGAPCTASAQCYSPYGLGTCLDSLLWAPSNYCSILDCDAPGLPDDLCGDGAQCVPFVDDVSICAADCAGAEDCSDGYACVDHDESPATDRVCWPLCYADEDCLLGDYCYGLSELGYGLCVPE